MSSGETGSLAASGIPRHILVYGAGAIGGYLGARLWQRGHRVTLLTRPATAVAIHEQGLIVEQEGNQLEAHPQVVSSLTEAFADRQRFDLILLTMKSYDLAAAVPPLSAALPAPTTLMTMQNGIGLEQLCIERFGSDCVIAGSLTTPVSRNGDNRLTVERADRGLALAPTQSGGQIDSWGALFQEAGVDTVTTADYQSLKWSKALLNIVGNATSAILDWPPGQVYEHAALFDLEVRMLLETISVMKAKRLTIMDLPGSPANRLATAVQWVPRFLLRPILTRLVSRGRGDKMPSFHIDLANGRGKSEVVYHNGAIAEAGEALGIATPVNHGLNDVLLQLTQSVLAWDDFRHNPQRLLAELKRYEG